LKVQDHITNDIDAFNYFIKGQYYGTFGSNNMFRNFIKALDLDPEFALASYMYAYYCYGYHRSNISAKKYINHAMDNRQKFPDYRNLMTRILYYSIMEDLDKTLNLAEWQYKIRPENIDALRFLIDVYYRNSFINESHDNIEKLNELVPDNTVFQEMLAESYIMTNQIDKGLKYVSKRVEEKPENPNFLLRKGQFHLNRGEWDEAEEAFQNAILSSPENTGQWSIMLEAINFARGNAFSINELHQFTGKYRAENAELSVNNLILNGHLINKADNQHPNLYHPTSDTSLVSYWGLIHTKYCKNLKGKVIKSITKQYSLLSPFILWKEDSLITNAKKLLEENKTEESLIAFQNAYYENPEHYYLANFIKHLEFILSDDFIGYLSIFDSYIGNYENNQEIYKVDHQYYIRTQGLDYLLLPISEDQFLSPSKYNVIYMFIKGNNQTSGLKLKIVDGREFFYERKVE